MGRSLADVLTGSIYLDALQPRTVELVLAAVVELFDRGFGDSGPIGIYVSDIQPGGLEHRKLRGELCGGFEARRELTENVVLAGLYRRLIEPGFM